MLNKVQASVFINMKTALSLPLIEQNVNSKVWADGKLWVEHKMPFCLYQAQRPSPIFTSKAVSIKACGVKGRLKPIIENLKKQGLLIPCNSPYNTPNLDAKESNDKWRLIQDIQIKSA